jgi:2-polyprenyl-3-methyl-5-hydroxy-6-metoxy-1,4-benzoquinol methylase
MGTTVYFPESRIEQDRLATLRNTLASLQQFIAGKRCFDFGASYGLSMIAMRELGAASLTGIEPDMKRVDQGNQLLAGTGTIHYVADTRQLPFSDGQFDTVLVNAVFEHIPQPREAWIREAWRMVAPGGHMIVNETPNKYLPLDYHTTGLMFVPWLPKKAAHSYAIARGKWNPEKDSIPYCDWDHSGWRGLGQRELFSCLENYRDVSPKTRLRHHVVGQIFDPYPTWVIQRF